MGDLYDFFAFTKFPKSLSLMTPDEEISLGRKDALRFWQTLKKLSPKSSLYQILGNHDIRPCLRILERFPEIRAIAMNGWKDLFAFDGVSTLMDHRDDLVIDDIVFEHGHFGKPGQHLAKNRKRTVIGHTHRAWTHFEMVRGDYLWEMNVGYVANPMSEPLSYPKKRYHGWTQGYGRIINDVPFFMPVRFSDPLPQVSGT